MPDLTDTIESVAGGPASASSDLGSAQAQDLSKLIEADKYLKGSTALTGSAANGGPKSGWGCVRMARAVPPGAAE